MERSRVAGGRVQGLHGNVGTATAGAERGTCGTEPEQPQHHVCPSSPLLMHNLSLSCKVLSDWCMSAVPEQGGVAKIANKSFLGVASPDPLCARHALAIASTVARDPQVGTYNSNAHVYHLSGFSQPSSVRCWRGHVADYTFWPSML
eukprot:692540-Pelagomonas_calceolata.AAC.1